MSRRTGSQAARRTEAIVVTGAASYLGASILHILERHNLKRRLIGIDRRPPVFPLAHTEFHQIDLAKADAERRLFALLKECGHFTTIVHTALPWEPVHRNHYAHRLMVSGSIALVRAAKRAQVRKLILASTTDVYGAFATNPQYLPETFPLRGGSQSYYLEARILVEDLFQKFAATGRNRIVTILRPCTMLGAAVSNFKTNFLQQPVIPSVLGFDPLVQFVHESDLLRAFIMVIERNAPGIYNIVGDGVMPLSRAIRIARKPSVPLPELLLRLAADVAWSLDMGYAPAKHVPFLKYPCVADGDKARRELGFVPVYTSQEAFLSFVGRERDAPRETA